jgi:hypothetical protein
MNKRKVFTLPVLALYALLVVGGARALSSASYAIEWDVIAGGGGRVRSTHYVMDSTVGQGAIGAASSANYRLGAGYWSGGLEEAAPTGTPTDTATPPHTLVYLPIALKSCP